MNDTKTSDRGAGRGLAWTAIAVVLGGCLVAAVGYAPTGARGGPDAVRAMVVGVGVSIVACLLGLVPVVLKRRGDHVAMSRAMMTGMTLRLMATILMVVALTLSGGIAVRPLLLWVAISYVLLLAVDVIGVATHLRRRTRNTNT